MIGVLPHPKIRGVRDIANDIAMFSDPRYLQEVLSVAEMLETEWQTDAHFTCYYVKGLDRWPRINKPALAGLLAEDNPVLTDVFVFDYDLPGHAEWTPESLLEFAVALEAIEKHSVLLPVWHTLYTTLHGARLLYRLSEPLPVAKAEQHLCWMIRLLGEAGLAVDPACKDWTRLFRCPRVLRDGTRSEASPYFHIESHDRTLDVSLLGTLPTKTVAKPREFRRSRAKCPPIKELEAILKTKDAKGHDKYSLVYDKAKKALKKNPYYGLCFENRTSGWNSGEYNDCIALYLGCVLPILVRKNLSIRESMAVVHPPLAAIPDTDRKYMEHSWNLLQDIYEREVKKINEDLFQRAEKETRKVSTLDSMVLGMRRWCSAIPVDDDLARDYVKRHVFISLKNIYYAMNEEGDVDDMPLSKEQLISRIRNTFLRDVIETYQERIRDDGTTYQVDITPSILLNNFTTVVKAGKREYLGDRGGYIKDIDGKNPEVMLPMYRRNDKLEPQYHPLVDEWLKALGGDYYSRLCAWIGHALDFEGGPICSLSINGDRGTGKLVLPTGLSECLVTPALAHVEDLTSQSSTLTRTPFLLLNEGMPKYSRFGKTPADQFKGLVAGDQIPINEKHMPIIYINNPVRVILTANDDGLLRALVKGNGMSFNTRQAVGERVLHLDVGDRANKFFASIGNRKTTAKPGETWISGFRDSDFVVAKHFLWLYENRDTSDMNQRFLVMGNTAPDGGNRGDVFSDIITTNPAAATVCYAVLGLLKKDKGLEVNGKVYVTYHEVFEFILEDPKSNRVELEDVIVSMQSITTAAKPKKIAGKSRCELDMAVLSRFAERHGVDYERLE